VAVEMEGAFLRARPGAMSVVAQVDAMPFVRRLHRRGRRRGPFEARQRRVDDAGTLEIMVPEDKNFPPAKPVENAADPRLVTQPHGKIPEVVDDIAGADDRVPS